LRWREGGGERELLASHVLDRRERRGRGREVGGETLETNRRSTRETDESQGTTSGGGAISTS
jgi:hypothetical protein